MSENASSGKGLAIFALILAIGAVVGMAFVYFEPIVAYERLKSGVYGVDKWTQSSMRGRLREAGIPLIASSIGAVVAFALAHAGRGARKLSMTARVLALLAIGVAGYVWAMHGGKIIGAL